MTSTDPRHDQRPLGQTGLSVSRLSLGTARWRSTGDRTASADDRRRLFERVTRGTGADRQIAVIDTANSYGDSEQLIGGLIGECGGLPDRVLLQTKADRDFGSGDFSGARMRRSLQESLDRLGLTSLPMVYIHDPENADWDSAMATDGPVAALVHARDQGLIDHLGLSGGSVGLMERYLRTGLFESLITHMRYTLVDRSADRLLTVAAELGIGVFNAAPYGGGLLTRWPATTRRYAYGDGDPELLAAADAMGRLCADHRIPLAAAALQFSLRDPRITSTIVGMLTVADLDATIGLAAMELPAALWTELDQLLPPRRTWQDADEL